MHSSSYRAPVSLSAPATPPQRSACSNTRAHTLVASRMTQASAPGRRSLNFRRAALGQSARLPARTSASDTSVRLRTASPPLAGSWLCPSLVTLPALPRVTPPPAAKPVEPDPTPASPPAVPQAAPPDPASLNPKPSDIQVGGKQYTKVAGLTWVERESTKPDSFADVSVGPNDLQSKDEPSPLKTAEAPKKR